MAFSSEPFCCLHTSLKCLNRQLYSVPYNGSVPSSPFSLLPLLYGYFGSYGEPFSRELLTCSPCCMGTIGRLLTFSLIVNLKDLLSNFTPFFDKKDDIRSTLLYLPSLYLFIITTKVLDLTLTFLVLLGPFGT